MPACLSGEKGLLRMGNDVNQFVDIFLNPEIKAPPSVDARLPYAARLVVLFCLERGVTEIAEEVAELLAEIALDSFRCFPERACKAFREKNPHRARALARRARTASLAVLNGPTTRPFLMSSIPSARGSAHSER